MPLGFTFHSVIIKKQSLLKILGDAATERPEFIQIIKNLLASPIQDDFLVGLESMSSDLDWEKSVLKQLGLIWNDGRSCVDYFIPSEGSCYADWLSFARIKEVDDRRGSAATSPHYLTFRHSDDFSGDIITFDGKHSRLKFPLKAWVLDRVGWVSVAKQEFGNHLHKPSLEESLGFLERIKAICPEPIQWNELYELLLAESCERAANVPKPLILAAWWDSSPSEKNQRFKELLRWAHKNDAGDVAWAYINLLRPDEWFIK